MKRCLLPPTPQVISLRPAWHPRRSGRPFPYGKLAFAAHLVALCYGSLCVSMAGAADWIFMPSYYSHDPQSGERVTQFAAVEPVFVEVPGDYVRSGYRHTQSRIQAGGSADYLHLTEEWGREVRPYGEWQRPFRPYSVPYDLWAPPFVPGGAPGSYYAPYGEFGYGYGAAPGRGYGPVPDPRYGHGPEYGPAGEEYGHSEQAPENHLDGRGMRESGGPGGRGADHPGRRRGGVDGYPGRFFDRPTTDAEFFWPRDRRDDRGESSRPDPEEGHPHEAAAHE